MQADYTCCENVVCSGMYICVNMDREEQFERFLGINTSDEEVIIGRNPHRKYSVYEASEYEGLISIFDEVTLTPYDTLVDYGCGMGRVLFFCNQRFMCNVTGIEYDDKIYEALLDNAEYYHVRFQGQRDKFKLLHMKAEDYVVRPEDNYFYFFNPFSMGILESTFNRILASCKGKPRKITIIMYYCTYEIMTTLRKFPFKLERIIKLPAYRFDPDEKVYVYTYE